MRRTMRRRKKGTVTPVGIKSIGLHNLPEDMLKFLLRCRPHGFKPNGLNHSYTATAIAVMFNDVKMAIHSSGENGNKNANNGISDLDCGAASKLTPL